MTELSEIPNKHSDMLKKEIHRLQNEWGTLTDLLGRLRQDYFLEVNQQRKIDLERQITDVKKERQEVETPLRNKERELSAQFPDSMETDVTHWLFVTPILWHHFSEILKFSKDIHDEFQKFDLASIKPLNKKLNDIDFAVKNTLPDFSNRVIEKEIENIRDSLTSITIWCTVNHFINDDFETLKSKFDPLDCSINVLLKESWGNSIKDIRRIQSYNTELSKYLLEFHQFISELLNYDIDHGNIKILCEIMFKTDRKVGNILFMADQILVECIKVLLNKRGNNHV